MATGDPILQVNVGRILFCYFGSDLGEGDPIQQFRESLANYMPTFTAADAFTQLTWGDAGISARVAPSCETKRTDETCVSVWGHTAAPDSAMIRRARFFAWPVSNAAVFEVGTPAEKASIITRLRERDPTHTPIALVLTRDDLEYRTFSERSEMQIAAKRLSRVAGPAEEAKELEHLALDAHYANHSLLWFAPSEQSVIVVPRLSSFSDVSGFRKVLDEVIGLMPVRWIHRPGP